MTSENIIKIIKDVADNEIEINDQIQLVGGEGFKLK